MGGGGGSCGFSPWVRVAGGATFSETLAHGGKAATYPNYVRDKRPWGRRERSFNMMLNMNSHPYFSSSGVQILVILVFD
jgi:hypothetical protein